MLQPYQLRYPDAWYTMQHGGKGSFQLKLISRTSGSTTMWNIQNKLNTWKKIKANTELVGTWCMTKIGHRKIERLNLYVLLKQKILQKVKSKTVNRTQQEVKQKVTCRKKKQKNINIEKKV